MDVLLISIIQDDKQGSTSFLDVNRLIAKIAQNFGHSVYSSYTPKVVEIIGGFALLLT